MDTLRRCIFRPYRKGMGPVFTLTTWDTHRSDNRGQTIIGYRLTMRTPRMYSPLDGAVWTQASVVVLFEGDDFAGSPMHADDSDETIRSLMTFLTLRPGDTDADYFEDYTAEQFAFCDEHAEALAMEVESRFGDES